MRLLLDRYGEAPRGYVQAKSVGEALNLLRKQDASHISFAENLANGETGLDLAKYLVLLAKDGLISGMTWGVHSGSNAAKANIAKAMGTVDFYTGVSDCSGTSYKAPSPR